MRKKTAIVVLLCILATSLAGCKCNHHWQEADCITPKTCTKCGETEGEPLGHKWECATYSTPKKCKVCEVEEGSPLTRARAEKAITSIERMPYHQLEEIEQLIQENFGVMTLAAKRQCVAYYVLCQEGPAFLESQIKEVLTDPGSYTVYNIKVHGFPAFNKEKGEFTGEVDLDYGAANKFGGMIRKNETFNVYFQLDVEDWDTWDVYEDWGNWDVQFSHIFTWDWY